MVDADLRLKRLATAKSPKARSSQVAGSGAAVAPPPVTTKMPPPEQFMQ